MSRLMRSHYPHHKRILTPENALSPLRHPRFTRHAASLLVLLTVACVAFLAPSAGQAARQFASVPAGSTIPSSTVRFSFYPCCADIGLPAVGIQQGFFKDVGITINPTKGFYYSASDQVLPSMQRGDHDITIFPDAAALSALTSFAENIPPTMFFDTYVGYAILAAPHSSAKSALQFMKQGLTFAQAAKKAVQQVRGQVVYTPPVGTTQPPYPGVMLSYAGMTLNDLQLHYLDDQKTAELAATPGRVQWVIPYSAPILVELVRSGFKPIIDVRMILQHDPHSQQAKELSHLVGDASTMTQRSFLTQHRDTVLRFASAMFRSVDYVRNKATRQKGWTIVANLINATQGTHLLPQDIGYIYKIVDPLFGWKDQPNLWVNTSSPYYVKSAIQAQVASLISNKTLPNRKYDLNSFLAAIPIYNELKALQSQADSLFPKTSSLTGAKKTLVTRARAFYSWHDYLDAVRFLEAALQ